MLLVSATLWAPRKRFGMMQAEIPICCSEWNQQFHMMGSKYLLQPILLTCSSNVSKLTLKWHQPVNGRRLLSHSTNSATTGEIDINILFGWYTRECWPFTAGHLTLASQLSHVQLTHPFVPRRRTWKTFPRLVFGWKELKDRFNSKLRMWGLGRSNANYSTQTLWLILW